MPNLPPRVLAWTSLSLLTVGVASAFIHSATETPQTMISTKIDPQAFSSLEVAENPDCVSNDEWPPDQIPISALIRLVDTPDLIRVTFDEAMNQSVSRTAWYVASCTGAAAPPTP